MSEIVIFDKDSYHNDGVYPPDLAKEDAGKHIGFYLRWMRDRNLLNEDGTDLAGDDYAKIGAARLCRRFDGVLTSEIMSRAGDAFSKTYYRKWYFEDYAEVLANLPGTIYHVPDDEASYALIREKLDSRHR